MSIGVRVSVGILGALVIICFAISFWALIQRQTLQGQNLNLHNEISADESKLSDLSSKARQLEDQAQQLGNKINQAQQDKAQLQNQYDELKQKSDTVQSQLDQANTDRDDWKSRVDTITKERDNLLEKLKNQPVKIVYKNRIVKVPVPMGALSPDQSVAAPIQAAGPVDVSSAHGDQYWASVLRQKAALQVDMQKAKYQLNQASLQVADLKRQNTDLEVEVKQLANEKDEIVQKIKYGQDLADNLSVDLARSRNDQEVVNERADRLKEQNLQLLAQIRDLSSNKVELERTISRLTNEKDVMQKKLIETESVIQSRIDDIWKIKQSLDKKLAENSPGITGNGMELPPIIVNSPGSSAQQEQQMSAPAATMNGGKTQGSIISINESNNFVIADLGQQNSAVNIGNTLQVFRDSNPIATLKVIQVRKDICAADIENKSGDLQVGDIVRFE